MNYTNGKPNGSVSLNDHTGGRVHLQKETSTINMTFEQLAATWMTRAKRERKNAE